MAIRPVYQLNTPHCTPVSDGGSCGGDDCAICCIIMAHDFATDGKIRPTQEQIRSRPGVPNTGGLSLEQVAAGILEFGERYKANGFELPHVIVRDGGSWSALANMLQTPSTLCIVFIDNGEWVDWCKRTGNERLGGDLEYRGTHAVVARNLLWQRKTVKVLNPLYDGRLDMPSRTRVAKGPQRVPINAFRNAVESRGGQDRADYVIVYKAQRIPVPEPPPIDPCADATEPSGKPGKAGHGAV